MTESLSPVGIKDVPQIVQADPLRISPALRAILILLCVFGLLVFVLELVQGDATYAWTSLQVNFTFWFCLAAASSCFGAVLQICNAQWSRPIRRIFQASTPFLIWSPLMLAVLFLGHEYLFVWAHEEIPGKGIWLSSVFVYVRDVLAILVLAGLAQKLLSLSLRADIGAIRSGLVGLDQEACLRWKEKKFDRYVSGWGNDPQQEIRKTTEQMIRLSPVVVIAYAVIMSLIAFDQIMSVDPHWYSTMFGGLYFMTAVYLAMAGCAMAVAMLRSAHPLFRAKIERRTLHDLGDLKYMITSKRAHIFCGIGVK